jgi:hypothetical protein
VLFELILNILLWPIGVGAIEGVKWIGEGSSIIARLVERLKPLLEALEELKQLLKGKLGGLARLPKAVEEGEKAIEVVAKTIRLRASGAQLRQMWQQSQNLLTHGTHLEEVAANQPIKAAANLAEGAAKPTNIN